MALEKLNYRAAADFITQHNTPQGIKRMVTATLLAGTTTYALVDSPWTAAAAALTAAASTRLFVAVVRGLRQLGPMLYEIVEHSDPNEDYCPRTNMLSERPEGSQLTSPQP